MARAFGLERTGSFDLGECVGWLEFGCSPGADRPCDEGTEDGKQHGCDDGGWADVGGELNGGGGRSA